MAMEAGLALDLLFETKALSMEAHSLPTFANYAKIIERKIVTSSNTIQKLYCSGLCM